jgi:hypothetical protein
MAYSDLVGRFGKIPAVRAYPVGPISDLVMLRSADSERF